MPTGWGGEAGRQKVVSRSYIEAGIRHLEIPKLLPSGCEDKGSAQSAPYEAKSQHEQNLLLQNRSPGPLRGKAFPRNRRQYGENAGDTSRLRKEGTDAEQDSSGRDSERSPFRHQNSHGEQYCEQTKPVMGCVETAAVDENDKEQGRQRGHALVHELMC